MPGIGRARPWARAQDIRALVLAEDQGMRRTVVVRSVSGHRLSVLVSAAMAITDTRLDEIAAWCEFTEDLSEERRHAQRRFFDEDDPRPVRYWPGAGDDRSRQRRFLGWFMFDHELPGGERAAARAARALYRGTAQEQALRAMSGTRFVLAIVASVVPGRSVLLELEHDHFEIR